MLVRNKIFGFIIPIMLIVGILQVLPTNISYALTGQDDWFTFDANTKTITGLTSNGKTALSSSVSNLTIPNRINNIDVENIGANVFKSNKTIETVTIPTGIKTIGEYAFYDTNIRSINLSNVKHIGDHSFQLSKLENQLVLNPETIGEYAFAGNNIARVEFGQNSSIETIPIYSFRNNKIVTLQLPDSLKTIGEYAFADNLLETLTLPTNIEIIENNAFTSNDLTSINIPDSLQTLGSNVFASNAKWILLEGNNQNVTSAKYDSGFGQVTKLLPVTFKYIEQATGQEIMPDRTVGDNIYENDNIFLPYSENTYTPPVLDKYVPIQSPITFNLSENNNTVTILYERSKRIPTINVVSKVFEQNSTVTTQDLLQGITAKDYRGRNITNISVSPSTLDTSVAGKTHKVYYTAVDSEGNEETIEHNILIGTNWGDIEICNGWQIKDFTYTTVEGKRSISGLSNSGNTKLQSQKRLCLPPHDLEGRPIELVYNLGNKGFTHIDGDWGSIVEIYSSAFAGNPLEEIPASWGKVTKIGNSAFYNTQHITTLPDSWGEVKTVGSYAFYNNQISTLPDSWGKIDDLGAAALRKNNLTRLPDSWGKIDVLKSEIFYENNIDTIPDNWGNITEIQYKAFSNNKLTTLPDSWGKVTSIQSQAFYINTIANLPNSWGKVSKLGTYTFYQNKIENIPDSWGEITIVPEYCFGYNKIKEINTFDGITEIGNYGFYQNPDMTKIKSWGSSLLKIKTYAFGYNGLVSIPDSWENVDTIDYAAFYRNKIEKLPDSWSDNITQLGNYAFAYNNIQGALPKDWKNITTIGIEAFNNNKITTIPRNWGKVNDIKSYAFASNKITTLPDSWGELTKLENRVFIYNVLENIPSDWGNITSIGEYNFYNTKIQTLPDSWGTVETISPNAFYGSPIKAFPESWGNVKSIGSSAFYNNKADSFPTDFTGLEYIGTSVFYNYDRKAPLVIKVDPNRLTQEMMNNLGGSYTYGYYNLPVTVLTEGRQNPNSVTSSGAAKLNPAIVTIKHVDTNGKILRENIEYETKGETSKEFAPTSIFGYSKPDSQTVTIDADTKEVVFVYEKLPEAEVSSQAKLTFDGITTHAEVGNRLSARINFDLTGHSNSLTGTRLKVNIPTNMRFLELSRTSQIKNYVYENGVLTIELNTVNAGSSFTIPLVFDMIEGPTAENKPYSVSATLLDSNNNSIAPEPTIDFTGNYSKPSLTKTANYDERDTFISDFDINETLDGVAEDGKNTVTYRFRVNNLRRNIETFTVIDTLPKYVSITGDEKTAVFNPQDNIGWVKVDENTVKYVGDKVSTNRNSTDVAKLVLAFPNAKKLEKFTNSVDVQMVPENMGGTEVPFQLADKITNYFDKYVYPVKGVREFYKYSTGLKRDHGVPYIIDSSIDKNKPITFTLTAGTTKDGYFTNPVFVDDSLDSRLMFSKITPKGIFKSGTVIIKDTESNVLFEQRYSSQSETIIPEGVARQEQIVLMIIPDENVPASSFATFEVETKLKDTTLELDSTKPFINKAVLNSDEGTYQKTKLVHIKKPINRIDVFKTTDYAGIVLSGKEGTYTVGVDADITFGAELKGFKLVDLLPSALNVVSFTPSQEFERLGGRAEIVDNYENTGKTAVLFTADNISKDNLGRFVVGQIKTRISGKATDGSVTNETYFTTNNVDELVFDNEDVAPDGSKASKAQVSIIVAAARELTTQKFVRKTDGLWTDHIQTYPNEEFEYKLAVNNYTDVAQYGNVIYDVLPTVDDYTTGGKRASQFANVWDIARQPILPQGWTIQYYNGDDPIGEYSQNNIEQKLGGLNWENTPSVNTKAVRIVGEQINARSSAEFILPVKAPDYTTNGIEHLPPTNLVGGNANNTFVYSNDGTQLWLEPNIVSNEIVPPNVNLSLKKTGFRGTPLAGATFGLFDSNGKQISTSVSDKDGNVEFLNTKATIGWYVKEITPPNDYILSTTSIVLQANHFKQYKNGSYSIALGSIGNTAIIKGSVKFTKLDANGNPYSGVSFVLSNNTYSFTASSNKQGEVAFYNVPQGNYVLKEIAPPNIQPMDDISVGINQPNQVVTPNNGTIVNNKSKISLFKLGIVEDKANIRFGDYQNVDGAKINATFELYKVEDNGNVQGLTQKISDVDVPKTGGSISNLEVNKLYALKETRVDEHYVPATKPFIFYVNEKGIIYTANNSDDVLNNIGQPVGTVKGLFAKARTQSSILLPNLKEIKTSIISVSKKDQHDNSVEGASFVLKQKQQNGSLLQYATGRTDNMGVVVFDNIPEGEYLLEETKAPNGYSANKFTARTIFVPKYEAKTFQIDAINTKLEVNVHKVEMLGKGLSLGQANSLVASTPNAKVVKNGSVYDVVLPLQGAEFDLREQGQSSVVEHLIVDNKGKASVQSLLDENKVYELVETVTPSGYIAGPVKTFRVATLSKLQGFDGTVDILVSNNKLKGRVVVSKLDEQDGKTLEGAVFSLRNTKDDSVQTLTTDDNGIVIFDNIDYNNEYVLTEVSAPDGYKVDETVRTIELTGTKDNGVYSVTVLNKKNKVDIPLRKVNQDGNTLGGAMFTYKKVCDDGTYVCDRNETVVETNSQGIVMIEGIEPGVEYGLVETRSPDGYSPLPERVRFVANSETDIVFVDNVDGLASKYVDDNNRMFLQIVNYAQGKLPVTGNNGLIWLVGASLGILLVGCRVLYSKSRIEHKK